MRTYKRLAPLMLSPPLRKGLASIKRGDCLVAFDRRTLYELRHEIKSSLGLESALIYGSLPPSVRKQQAQLFNDPNSGVDILVASDAIGMGLNLHIQRVVFVMMNKFNGRERVPLKTTEILQIGGRAGRFQSRYPVGYVTCMDPWDHDALKRAFKTKLKSLPKAALSPTFEQVRLFSERFPQWQLHDIFHFMQQNAVTDGTYFVGRLDAMIDIAECLAGCGLTTQELFVFTLAPANFKRYPAQKSYLRQFAMDFARGRAVTLPKALRREYKMPVGPDQISSLEGAYSSLELYIWLGYRFSSKPVSAAADADSKNSQQRRESQPSALEATLLRLGRAKGGKGSAQEEVAEAETEADEPIDVEQLQQRGDSDPQTSIRNENSATASTSSEAPVTQDEESADETKAIEREADRDDEDEDEESEGEEAEAEDEAAEEEGGGEGDWGTSPFSMMAQALAYREIVADLIQRSLVHRGGGRKKKKHFQQ